MTIFLPQGRHGGSGSVVLRVASWLDVTEYGGRAELGIDVEVGSRFMHKTTLFACERDVLMDSANRLLIFLRDARENSRI